MNKADSENAGHTLAPALGWAVRLSAGAAATAGLFLLFGAGTAQADTELTDVLNRLTQSTTDSVRTIVGGTVGTTLSTVESTVDETVSAVGNAVTTTTVVAVVADRTMDAAETPRQVVPVRQPPPDIRPAPAAESVVPAAPQPVRRQAIAPVIEAAAVPASADVLDSSTPPQPRTPWSPGLGVNVPGQASGSSGSSTAQAAVTTSHASSTSAEVRWRGPPDDDPTPTWYYPYGHSHPS